MAAARLLVVLLVLGLLVGPSARGDAQEAERARLGEARQRIESVQQEIGDQEAAVGEGEAALAAADRQLTEVLGAVDAAQAAVDRQQRAVDRVGARVVARDAEVAQADGDLTARAESLYRRGRVDPLLLVLEAADDQRAMDRLQLGQQVARQDRRVIETSAAARDRAAAEVEALEYERGQLAGLLGEQEALLADVEALREDRSLQLAASRAGLDELRDTEQHLEEDVAQLAQAAEAAADRAAQEAAARAAARARRPAPAPAAPELASSPGIAAAPSRAAAQAGAGGYVWPVDGTVTSEYGYRWGRLHAGIDIAAPTGTPIYAARPATVEYAGWMGGYGQIVLLDHGDGTTTAYAHQSQLLTSVGRQVAAGEQIGAVGSTGNSTGPHVHFEVRVGGSTRNPRGYLG